MHKVAQTGGQKTEVLTTNRPKTEILKNVCQPSCFALLLFTSYLENLSYNKK